MIWTCFKNFLNPFLPLKSGFFQRKGRKRVKEWREVTFMKEWVKALYIGYHQALDLPKNLFPFPRTGHLKISLGPTQFLYSKFHGLIGRIWLNSSTQMKIGLGVINCNICIGSTYDCLKFPFNLDSFWMNREDGGFLEIKLLNKYGYKCFHLHLAASYRFPLECPGVEIYSEIMWDHKLKVVEIVIDCMLATNTFGR